MKLKLSGKTAIVTGSTAGIGYTIAKGLAQAGAEVVVNGHTAAAVESAVAKLTLEVAAANIRGVAADVGSADGCAALVAAQPSADILVNNVGIHGLQDFFEIQDTEWTSFFEVNVLSAVRLSRAYMPGMVQRQWGRVLFLSSESALNIPADMIHYGFTTTAVLAISHGLAKRIVGTGVTVNAILPGPTSSDALEDMLKEKRKTSGLSLEEMETAIVMKHRPSSIVPHAATMEEVANLVVYAASPQASATTGAALRVDGGVVEAIPWSRVSNLHYSNFGNHSPIASTLRCRL